MNEILGTWSGKFLASFFIIFILVTFAFNFVVGPLNNLSGYSQLASSFLQGKLYLDSIPNTEDAVIYNSKYFIQLGPFPALVLMPGVFIFNLFKITFYQGYFQFFVTLGILYLAYKLARIYKYKNEDSLYLSYAFCFASVYQVVALITWSSYFAHSVSVFLGMLAIFEFLTKKRYFFIGLLFALVFATRPIAGLGIIFFVIEIMVRRKLRSQSKFMSLSKLFSPVFSMAILLLLYNKARFGDILDNGYTRTFTRKSVSMDNFPSILFNVKNFLSNLYLYLLRLPSFKIAGIFPVPFVNYPGVSFFVTSPIFFNIFKLNFRDKLTKLFIIPIFVILLPLLSYYWSGWIQVGPRYLLDLLPFVFLLLLLSFRRRRLSKFTKFIILVSSAFNFYLFLTVFL